MAVQIFAVGRVRLPSADDPPGGIDDRPPTLTIEEGGHVRSRASLGPIAGNQEEGAGHPPPEILCQLGMGGPDDRAQAGVSRIPLAFLSPFLQKTGHFLADGLRAVFGPALASRPQVLKLAGRGIGGLAEDENVLIVLDASV